MWSISLLSDEVASLSSSHACSTRLLHHDRLLTTLAPSLLTLPAIENLPNEVRFHLAEIRTRDELAGAARKQAHLAEKAYFSAMVKGCVNVGVNAGASAGAHASTGASVMDTADKGKTDANADTTSTLAALEAKVGEHYARACDLVDEKIQLGEDAIELVSSGQLVA